METKTKCRAIGAAILAAGVAVVLTGHVILTFFVGMTFGIYTAGLAVAFIEKIKEGE